MSADQVILVFCIGVFTLLVATWDWRFHRIPNKFTVPMFGLGLLFWMAYGAYCNGIAGLFHGLGFSLLGFATGFGILFLVWILGGGGGGDVKLMGALGAWLGAKATFEVLLIGTLFACVFSITVLAWQFFVLGPERAKNRFLQSPDAKKRRRKGETEEQAKKRLKASRRLVPFAVPVALATYLVLAAGIYKFPILFGLFS